MTKKLEELFNLPEIEKQSESIDNEIKKIEEVSNATVACPTLLSLNVVNDSDLDSLARQALDGYEMLVDLGLNVEPHKSARLFEVASTMLKHSIDAKNMKITNKIKIIELQLKKDKLDQDLKILETRTNKKSMKDINTLDTTNLSEILNEDNDKVILADRNHLMDNLKLLEERNKK